MFRKIVVFIFLLTVLTAAQNNPATINEYKKVFTTYPFSDPNPLPVMGNIYPYFRFDGYTNKPFQQEWKVVEMENDYIKLMILPEIGGKIWAAVEKSTGKSFVYFNHVVKFRDIAMRGPWTSGGIEPNYGIIGHTPNCATPVDYMTLVNNDGSVSCFIGTLDLLTRTNWRIEIKLEKDKAYLTTRSIWYNSTPLEQPYYTWMNTGLKAKGNLEFIYPGTNYLGHGGEYSSWPVNEKNGKTISFYEQNNFGGPKSYHVFGKYTDFFGAYWHDDNFGMVRYSTHNDKPGKKIWIWGLSPQGMIWENLLSDTDGQYVEVQSGRLFNQTADQSTFTPFKHRGFAPYSFDTWTEYWYPVMNIKGFVVANDYGAFNLKNENGLLKIYFSPVQNIDDELVITSGERNIYHKKLNLKPLQVFTDSINISEGDKYFSAAIGSMKLIYKTNNNENILNRPVESPKDFDWNSVYGLYLQGKENIRGKYYESAEEKLKECLKKDPNYLPALTDLSALMYRKMKYVDALALAKKALSIDTYDGYANYNYGLANVQLRNMVDAKDGFDIASHSVEFRTAAYTELAKIYFKEHNYERALTDANRSLDNNQFNLSAYQIISMIYRVTGQNNLALDQLDKTFAVDPLNHLAAFEKYLLKSNDKNKNDFISSIRNELPQETFLELAAWYFSLNLFDECGKVLELAPQTPEIIYWRAFIKNKLGDNSFGLLIEKANSLSPELIFPFRSESAVVFDWVLTQTDNWKPKYFLGLINWDRRNYEEAKKLFSDCGNNSDYSSFYFARYELFKKEKKESAFADLEKGFNMDPGNWRNTKMLTNYFIEEKQYEKALQVSSGYYSKNRNNYIIGMLNAKTLLLNNKYEECIRLLKSINILPYEGATDGRQLWREVHLMTAFENIKAKKYNVSLNHIAEAKEWPINLGVGKPYQADIDERLEDWMEYYCYFKMNNEPKIELALKKIIEFNQNGFGINYFLTVMAHKKIGNTAKAISLMKEWEIAEPVSELRRWCEKLFNGEYSSPSVSLLHDFEVKFLGELLMNNL